MKLSRTQQELLDAMKSGVTVRHVNGRAACWFRDDTMDRCTQAVDGLIKKGYAEAFVAFNSGRYMLALKEQT